MAQVAVSELKKVVEAQLGCTAALIQAVPVKESFEGKAVWEGVVHVFRIYGHPQARQAYARIAPCFVELCEAVVAVNDVKRPSQFGQERDCLFPFRSER
jgi:hypothetical protein